MAHSNNSIIVGRLRGSLGKELVFREWDGKTVVSKSPKRRRKRPTPAQAEVRERFLLATKYAKAVTNGPDPGMKEAYATVVRPRQNVYSRALEDFLSQPVVKSIDVTNYKGAIGDRIIVRAVDDFRVVGVRVEIYAANGTLLETGNAEQTNNIFDWNYTATRAINLSAGGKVKAIASDVPRNERVLEVSF